jgi:tetratricopeptide (TPR) repeat protein
MRTIATCILTVLLSTSCGHGADLFREALPSETGITWLHENGHSGARYLPETAGPGVAIFDYNNDGLMDILLVNSGTSSFYHPSTPLKHALYRNNGNGTFTDVTKQAGIAADLYAQGIAIGDYDNDGFDDIFISGFGKCVLYHNNGNGTFTDVTAASGIASPKWGTSALWFDYDNDGRLDLFVGEFADYSDLRSCPLAASYGGSADNLPTEQAYYCNPKQFAPVASHLYRNLGGGRFADVSASTGITASPGKVWGVVATDINHDGFMDLFAANDTMANFLWMNEGGKKFDEIGVEAGVAYNEDGLPRSGMGVDAGDFDGDGTPELTVSNIDAQNTSLYKNTGGEAFQDLNLQIGLARPTRMLSGWGLRFLDYDNDGWLDLIQVNSHPDDLVDLRNRGVTYREPVVLLHNLAGMKLEDVSALASPAFLRHYAGRGLAVGDLNNDGYPDVVFTENGGPPHILMNNAVSGNNWLGLALRATKANPAAAGVTIRWCIAGKVFSRLKGAGGSFLSSSDPREILGSGKASIEWIEIQWPAPSHAVDRLDKPAMNKYHRIVEGDHPVAKPAVTSFASPSAVRLVRVSAPAPQDGPNLWPQAKAAMEKGDFTTARELLLRAVKIYPRDASLWFHLGASCGELNDVDAAIAAFERARALDTRQPQTDFNLGLLYWRAGDLGKAKQAYRAGLALNPTDSDALKNFSLLLMKTGDYKNAIAPLLRLKDDHALGLQARAALIECYLEIGAPAKADSEVDELLRSGLVSPAAESKLAGVLIQHGDLAGAEKLLVSSLATDPNQAQSRAILGGVYLEQKKFAPASDCFERAIQLAPDSPEFAIGLARTLLAWKQQQAALAFLKSGEPRFASVPDYQYFLALAYFGVTQFQDSVATLQKLLGTNPPRQDRIYFLLGDSYLNLGNYDQAEQSYKKAIAINPKDTAYYEALASLERREGSANLGEAIAALEAAHRLNPKDTTLALQLALSYEAKGQATEAAALIENVIAQAPNLVPAHVALARIDFRLGKRAQAKHETELVKELAAKAQQARITSGATPPEKPANE